MASTGLISPWTRSLTRQSLCLVLLSIGISACVAIDPIRNIIFLIHGPGPFPASCYLLAVSFAEIVRCAGCSSCVGE